MTEEDTPSMDKRYQSEDGRVLTRRRMAMMYMRESKPLERVGDAYRFDGTLFTPIEGAHGREE